MLKIKQVSVDFNGDPALIEVSVTIKQGDFVYLVGPTGAGKTTLMRTIYMDVKPDKGYVAFGEFNSKTIKKRSIPYLRRFMGIIFQDNKILEDRTALDNILFALGSVGMPYRTAKKRSMQALMKVGLLVKRDSLPGELSGGELKRLCVARAISHEPQLILADEPTGNLDPISAEEVIAMLKGINSRGTTVLIATHNYRVIKQHPGKIIFLRNGRRIVKKKR